MRHLCIILFFPAALLLGQGNANGAPGRAKDAQLISATDWFRRADDLTNIRLPGSAPFHMKVAFRGFPALELNPLERPSSAPLSSAVTGHPFVISGEGVYEETWLSPEKWRREVTLGSYHAVEVRADGVRKFQGTSDYEPLRILMLLGPLLSPVSRYLLEPELKSHPEKWKLEHLMAGSMPYVRASSSQVFGQEDLTRNLSSYDFLPTGILVRAVGLNMVTTWSDDVLWSGRVVARSIVVSAMGHSLLEANVKIEAADSALPGFTLAGPAADPGTTLRPLVGYEVKNQWDAIRPGSFVFPPELGVPEGSGVSLHLTFDRRGTPREMEIIDAIPTPVRIEDTPPYLRAAAKAALAAVQHQRVRPATVDGAPCEYVGGWMAVEGPSSAAISGRR
ncbi:MAG TPA: hypothetical protein VHZ25_11205 [Acidobacteriaceae bacterium]|jgi:hypothetical protein|nr:hypothetical protein [Acidobacteriaceae bacterium]